MFLNTSVFIYFKNYLIIINSTKNLKCPGSYQPGARLCLPFSILFIINFLPLVVLSRYHQLWHLYLLTSLGLGK